jgi:cytochrome c oxidase assembly protein subunit 15
VTKKSNSIAAWLFICAAALFLTMLVGAATRLTESGLSIVEWKPVTGALPPLNETDWQQAFSLYQTSPQYKTVNVGMSFDEFRTIYYWEWSHRLLARLIGVIYAIPLAWFWIRGKLPEMTRKPLLGILALGFLQGALGWFMVKSGLVDQPAVSHYRLAAHLMMAVLIFCCLLRMGLWFSVKPDPAAQNLSPLRIFFRIASASVALTMIWGAFVAGLRAGVIYNNDFPWMGKHLWPGEIFHYTPWWINFFENHATVQFMHRVLAVTTLGIILSLLVKSFVSGLPRRVNFLLMALWGMVCTQVGLGIITLLTHVNIVVATVHQAGALTLLALLMALLHEIPHKEANRAS